MHPILRQETSLDHEAVSVVIQKAFENEEFSDQKEHFLVERLRKSKSFIPELSIVAELNNKVVGHILLTKIKIVWSAGVRALALAPVSVLPEFQRKGIGSQLIEATHRKAQELGYTSIVLMGHENYYPRFGYVRADEYGIELPFDVPKENCMLIELVEEGLKGVSGIVEYPEELGIEE